MLVFQAGGSNWRVQEDDSKLLFGDQPQQYFDLVFNREEEVGDRVELRWVPRPTRLTEGLARKLFELAGERLWRDPRTGSVYRIMLEDVQGPEADEPPDPLRSMRVHFRQGEHELSTSYDLDHPLGYATQAELEGMLDRASPTGKPVPRSA